jgi:hypothetical protein
VRPRMQYARNTGQMQDTYSRTAAISAEALHFRRRSTSNVCAARVHEPAYLHLLCYIYAVVSIEAACRVHCRPLRACAWHCRW